jgi:phosphate starvation-inducible PhoH-like protein
MPTTRKIASKKIPKRPEETERIQKEAAKFKGPIKYQVELNEEQKEAKRLIFANQITVLTGKAGSGKTMAAVIAALDLLFKKEIKKIFITRPAVTREEMGFLPGGIEDKLDPFLIPIYDNLEKCVRDPNQIKKMLECKEIDIAPIAYMRGRTIDDAMLIIDEAQNVDDESIKMCLTRLGKTGKIIVCGDSAQIDLKNKNMSGLDFVASMAHRIDGMSYLDLKANHRSPLVEAILQEYEAKERAEKAEREQRRMLKD